MLRRLPTPTLSPLAHRVSEDTYMRLYRLSGDVNFIVQPVLLEDPTEPGTFFAAPDGDLWTDGTVSVPVE